MSGGEAPKGLFELPATQPPDALPAGEKRARGAYYTPDALAVAICGTLDWLVMEPHQSPCSILEPGCGGGAFLRAAWDQWSPEPDQLIGVDLVPACTGPGTVRAQDLFEVKGSFDLILGNPDFSIAEKAVRHCLALLEPDGYLAFLLRASFEESAARVPLFKSFPLFMRQQIAQRPTFTGGGTDSAAYALFVWKQGWTGPNYVGLPPLVWR